MLNKTEEVKFLKTTSHVIPVVFKEGYTDYDLVP